MHILPDEGTSITLKLFILGFFSRTHHPFMYTKILVCFILMMSFLLLHCHVPFSSTLLKWYHHWWWLFFFLSIMFFVFCVNPRPFFFVDCRNIACIPRMKINSYETYVILLEIGRHYDIYQDFILVKQFR